MHDRIFEGVISVTLHSSHCTPACKNTEALKNQPVTVTFLHVCVLCVLPVAASPQWRPVSADVPPENFLNLWSSLPGPPPGQSGHSPNGWHSLLGRSDWVLNEHGIPQLQNSTHLLSSLSLRNAPHIYYNLSDNTFASCQTHAQYDSSVLPNCAKSPWQQLILCHFLLVLFYPCSHVLSHCALAIKEVSGSISIKTRTQCCYREGKDPA